jgi:hypothetical protein
VAESETPDNRQLAIAQSGHRSVYGRARRREGHAHSVAGVFEQPAAWCGNDFPQSLIVSRLRGPHRVGFGFSPPR